MRKLTAYFTSNKPTCSSHTIECNTVFLSAILFLCLHFRLVNFLPKFGPAMRTLYEEKLIAIPAECTVTLKEKVFTFEGPLGRQTYDVTSILFTFDIFEGNVRIRSWHSNRKKHGLLGTIASHIRNCITGVVKGFKYVLKAAYKHFPINIGIQDDGKSVTVKNFLGSKDVCSFPVRGQSKAMIGDSKEFLIVQGININDVSQTAAHISNVCAKRKMHDVRVFMDGIYIMTKTTMVE